MPGLFQKACQAKQAYFLGRLILFLRDSFRSNIPLLKLAVDSMCCLETTQDVTNSGKMDFNAAMVLSLKMARARLTSCFLFPG